MDRGQGGVVFVLDPPTGRSRARREEGEGGGGSSRARGHCFTTASSTTLSYWLSRSAQPCAVSMESQKAGTVENKWVANQTGALGEEMVQ